MVIQSRDIFHQSLMMISVIELTQPGGTRPVGDTPDSAAADISDFGKSEI
jgi:hypothetical protein